MGRKRIAGLVLACGGLLAAGGCLGADPLVSGLVKVAGGNILSLEVPEVQAITVWAEDKASVEQVPLTDEQAQAVLQFLADNEINTLADAQYFVEHPDELVISDEVKRLVGEAEVQQFLEQLQQASG